MTVPVSADENLEEEQKGIIEFMKREAGRSEELTSIPLETEMTIFVDNPQIRFKTRFTNTAKDHRIRLLVKTHNTHPSNDSESIYEVVTRPNKPAASWENPENPQHQQAFVSLYDDEKGVTVSNKGLNEYEILGDDTIAVTILRASGELGDWGYFPTPEAQCLREFEVSMLSNATKPKNASPPIVVLKPCRHRLPAFSLLDKKEAWLRLVAS